MERLYPMREFVKKTPVAATPLGKLFTKKKVSAQPSMSSLGDIADGDHISNFSKEYPPNQEGYMRMHRTNLSDGDTGATIPLFYLVISSVLTITIQNHRCIPRSRFELSTLRSHRLAREMPWEMPPTRTNYLTTLAPTLDPITSPSPPTIPLCAHSSFPASLWHIIQSKLDPSLVTKATTSRRKKTMSNGRAPKDLAMLQVPEQMRASFLLR
jgi:hypothetical protein